ncbi:DUF29 domain-containing protein [Azospirillum halopraeferens]|uniref:DUF29 domain-containing protein n=1 Tax=Azospirillum halopraeferens TaxID=34010 RepID=UPI0003F4EDA0|nr:DUF29 domain-containing protein [Azospirillum halopraeferens]
MPDGSLFERDFYAWTREQAAALRRMLAARANTELDLEHLAEAVEEMGNSDLGALQSDLARVIEHLLKLEYSPAADPRREWVLSVIEHRGRAQFAIERSGTLKRMLPDIAPGAWRHGRTLAAKAMQMLDAVDPRSLPAECPYGIDQILDEDFFPANRHGSE